MLCSFHKAKNPLKNIKYSQIIIMKHNQLYIYYYSTTTMSGVTREMQEQLDNALFKKLEELTMKIPSDPSLYKEDIDYYSKMYQEEFEKLLGDIQKKNQRVSELLIFLSRNVKHFSQKLGYIPTQVIDLLKNHGQNLHPYVRKKCVGSIMILRAKNILYPVETIQFLMTLFNVEDKELRKILYKYLLNDIRRMNRHHRNVKINQQIRSNLHSVITKNGDKMAEKAIKLMIDLYKRNIWTDNKCVNIIAEGCFSQSPKVRMIAAHFLYLTTEPLEELSDSDEDQKNNFTNPSQIKFKKGITKHTKNKEKQVQKEKKRAARRLRKKEIQARTHNFMPIDLIYNPQDFAEKLYNIMSKKNIRFNHRLACMALISRLIWRHKLILLPWYGALVKYMEPKQKEVSRVLTYFAESVHENVPDDEVETVVKHIIEKFVNDRCSEYSMTIGLNTIREVYGKLSSIITEDSMMYLCTYYDYKNKNVRMAAKALINLVREINPYLLEKKYRGRGAHGEQVVDWSKGMNNKVKDSIDGAELLEHEGDVPIYMDKVLTDEDFKMIRKLKRKQEEDKEWGNLDVLEEKDEIDPDDEDNWEEIDEQNAEEDEEDQEGEEGQEEDDQDEDEDGEQINWEDCQEMEDLVEGEGEEEQQGEQQEDQQELQQQQDEDEEDDGDQEQGSEDDEDDDDDQNEQEESEEQQRIPIRPVKVKNVKLSKKEVKRLLYKRQREQEQEQQHQFEERQKPTKRKKENSKKNAKNEEADSEEDDDSDFEDVDNDQNPHGFISVDQIGFYKKSKGEIKAERRQNNESKPKFKHKPKEKKGGSSNREKQKLKPLMMLRSKKNKIRNQQKQVKLTIKNLKQQLGKVKSGKEAKKMKNKRIIKLAGKKGGSKRS